jgi:hypothetical protein
MGNLAGLPPDAYLYGERLTIALGLITLTFALAIILSCRSYVSWTNRIGLKDILKNNGYRLFYKYHSYYWWGFWFVFGFHLFNGFMHIFMLPAVPDTDAFLHWYSLGTGLTALVAVGGIIISCRVLPGPLSIIFNRQPLTNPAYKIFYKFHSYYWLIFLAIIAAHYMFGFLHSGLWPE